MLLTLTSTKMPSQEKYIVRSDRPGYKVPNVSVGEYIECKMNEVIRKDPNRTLLVSLVKF